MIQRWSFNSYTENLNKTKLQRMFCPDEDCSPAVETSAFDDIYVSQFVVGRKIT